MKSSKSSLFLMELIIAILFFALASAVCIQLFVKSHLLGKTTTAENKALLMCQNFSEIYLGILPEYYNTEPDTMKGAILSLVKEDPAFAGITDFSEDYTEIFGKECAFTLLLCYDSDWTACSYENSIYQILFIYKGYDPKEDVYNASTYAYQLHQSGTTLDEKYTEIYHLDLVKHIPERMQ